MTKPYFSIIVPIYNIKEYINECIDSILDQTYPNFELILVDDGSTDGCDKICDTRKGEDDRIIVIHKPNGGLVSARKAGAEVAHGDYIICIDGDDWVDENLLTEASDIINKSDPDLISFGYYEAYGEDYHAIIYNESKKYNRNEISKEIFPALIYPSREEKFPNNIWAKVFKRELYLECQTSVNDYISMGEDTACVVPYVAKCNSIYMSDKCMYYYRQNEKAMTKVKKPLPWISPKLIDSLLREKLSICKYDFTPQICARTLHAVFNVGASQFYGDDAFPSVQRQIQKHYSEMYIRKACDGTALSNLRSRFIYITVKHKLVYVLFVYSRIRKK